MNNTAWLIFRDGNHKFKRILKKGYGHVSIIYKDKFNWILVAPKERKLEIVILPYRTEDKADEWLAVSKEMTVYKIIYDEKNSNYFFPRFLIGFSCVSFVKYFLGYKDYSVTPYQLCKNLIKHKHNIISYEQI